MFRLHQPETSEIRERSHPIRPTSVSNTFALTCNYAPYTARTPPINIKQPIVGGINLYGIIFQ